MPHIQTSNVKMIHAMGLSILFSPSGYKNSGFPAK